MYTHELSAICYFTFESSWMEAKIFDKHHIIPILACFVVGHKKRAMTQQSHDKKDNGDTH